MIKQTQEKLERILLLDDCPECLPKVEGITLDVIQEAPHYDSWFLYCNPGSGVYGSTPEKEAMIREVTSNKKVDYVVIGNNCGTGVRKAAAVAEDMRADKACVVWNSYQRGDEAKYAGLGFKHFMSRSDLAEHLEKYLRAKHLGDA